MTFKTLSDQNFLFLQEYQRRNKNIYKKYLFLLRLESDLDSNNLIVITTNNDYNYKEKKQSKNKLNGFKNCKKLKKNDKRSMKRINVDSIISEENLIIEDVIQENFISIETPVLEQETVNLTLYDFIENAEVIHEKDQINNAIKNTDIIAQQDDIIAQQDDTIAQQDDIIAQQDDTIAQQDDIIAQKDDIIAQQDDIIAINISHELEENIEIENNLCDEITKETLLQIKVNVDVENIQLMLFDIEIVLNRIFLRVNQTQSYIQEYKPEKDDDVGNLTKPNSILYDIIVSIQQLYNMLSKIIGNFTGEQMIINFESMTVTKLQKLLDDTVEITRNLQWYTERFLRDIHHAISNPESDSFETRFYDNKDNLMHLMFSTCRLLCKIISPYLMNDTNLGKLNYSKDLEEDKGFNNGQSLDCDLSLNLSFDDSSTINLSENGVQESVKISEIMNDPYIYQYKTQDCSHYRSQMWRGLMTENCKFFYNRYNKQFKVMTGWDVDNVNIKLASNNYEFFQTPFDAQAASYVLEVYNFPSNFSSKDVEITFYDYFYNKRANFHWLTKTSGLLVVQSSEDAKRILTRPWPKMLVRDMGRASKLAQHKCWIMGYDEKNTNNNYLYK